MWIHLLLLAVSIFAALYLLRLRDSIEETLQMMEFAETIMPLTKTQRYVRIFGKVSKIVLTVLIVGNCLFSAIFLGAIVRGL